MWRGTSWRVSWQRPHGDGARSGGVHGGEPHGGGTHDGRAHGGSLVIEWYMVERPHGGWIHSGGRIAEKLCWGPLSGWVPGGGVHMEGHIVEGHIAEGHIAEGICWRGHMVDG